MRVMNTDFSSIEQLAGKLPKKEGSQSDPLIKNSQGNSVKSVFDGNRRETGQAEALKEGTFADILAKKQKPQEASAGQADRPDGGLRFSKHASLRLSDRNIELSDGQLERLTSGTQRAGEKGINESLVIMDEMAFIVNVKNNTVITAMNQSEADENVFTNIDGAVIV